MNVSLDLWCGLFTTRFMESPVLHPDFGERFLRPNFSKLFGTSLSCSHLPAGLKVGRPEGRTQDNLVLCDFRRLSSPVDTMELWFMRRIPLSLALISRTLLVFHFWHLENAYFQKFFWINVLGRNFFPEAMKVWYWYQSCQSPFPSPSPPLCLLSPLRYFLSRYHLVELAIFDYTGLSGQSVGRGFPTPLTPCPQVDTAAYWVEKTKVL